MGVEGVETSGNKDEGALYQSPRSTDRWPRHMCRDSVEAAGEHSTHEKPD